MNNSILTRNFNVKKIVLLGISKGIGTAPTDPDNECLLAFNIDSLRAVLICSQVQEPSLLF